MPIASGSGGVEYEKKTSKRNWQPWSYLSKSCLRTFPLYIITSAGPQGAGGVLGVPSGYYIWGLAPAEMPGDLSCGERLYFCTISCR